MSGDAVGGARCENIILAWENVCVPQVGVWMLGLGESPQDSQIFIHAWDERDGADAVSGFRGIYIKTVFRCVGHISFHGNRFRLVVDVSPTQSRTFSSAYTRSQQYQQHTTKFDGAGIDRLQKLFRVLLVQRIHWLLLSSGGIDPLHWIFEDKFLLFRILKNQVESTVMMSNSFRCERSSESALIIGLEIRQILFDVDWLYLLENRTPKIGGQDFEGGFIESNGFRLAVVALHLNGEPHIIDE